MRELDYFLAIKNYDKTLFERMNFIRSIALAIDKDPSLISKYTNHFAIRGLCFDRISNCYDRTKLLEAYAYADSGVLLAAPGPSLAGLMIRELAEEEQKEYFFRIIENNKSSSFLAVTEPNKGSDAGKMETIIKKKDKNTYYLTGHKWLVGHGIDASIGVVIARLSDKPLGMIAILLKPELLLKKEVYRESLQTVGLRGARLSRLVFNNLEISSNELLGMHLSPLRRGMMAMMKTFNRMRPAVAAFAIGHSQAVIDYLLLNCKKLNINEKRKIQQMENEINLARLLLYDSAKKRAMIETCV